QPVPVVPAPAAEHAQDLAGEGLVEFDQVVVGEAVPGAGEQFVHGGDGAEAHQGGVAAGRARACEGTDRLEAESAEAVVAEAEHSRRGEVRLAPATRGHYAAGLGRP